MGSLCKKDNKPPFARDGKICPDIIAKSPDPPGQDESHGLGLRYAGHIQGIANGETGDIFLPDADAAGQARRWIRIYSPWRS
jgi:hypothetical protein